MDAVEDMLHKLHNPLHASQLPKHPPPVPARPLQLVFLKGGQPPEDAPARVRRLPYPVIHFAPLFVPLLRRARDGQPAVVGAAGVVLGAVAGVDVGANRKASSGLRARDEDDGELYIT